jgi:hypothetical protein
MNRKKAVVAFFNRRMRAVTVVTISRGSIWQGLASLPGDRRIHAPGSPLTFSAGC